MSNKVTAGEVYAVVDGKTINAHSLTKSDKPSLVYAVPSKNSRSSYRERIRALKANSEMIIERVKQLNR
jgi:hypothetical protein